MMRGSGLRLTYSPLEQLQPALNTRDTLLDIAREWNHVVQGA